MDEDDDFGTIREYHEWLFEAHCEYLFRFDEHMTPDELAYLERCAELAEAYELPDPEVGQPDLSYFSYSSRIIGNEVNSSRLAYGSIGAPEAAFEAALPILRARRIELPKLLPAAGLLFYGLGWDFQARGFKVYYRVPEVALLRDIRPAFFAHAPAKHLSEGLWSAGFEDGRLVEEKLYFYPIDDEVSADPLMVGSQGRAIVASDRRGAFAQYDVADSAVWYQRLGDVARSIVDLYEGEEIELDTIAYEAADRCTLYFPRDPYFGDEDE